MINDVLKKSVLLYAFQGKLSKNIDSSIYYKSICEKIHKNIKYDKKDYLFEIPDKWELLKFDDIIELYTGNSIPENIKKSRYTNLAEGYNYIGTKDVNFDGTVVYDNGVKIPYDEKGFKYADIDDILLCIEGGSVGKKITLLDEKVCFGNKLCKFHSEYIKPEYLYYFLQSPVFLDNFKDSISGLIGGVGTTKIKKMFIPIPDIHEQEEIIDIIKKYLDIINDIKNTEDLLSDLKKSFPIKMRKAVLLYAFQGKLSMNFKSKFSVYDLINDCISSKNELINKKIIKKDREIKPLTEEDIPYNIPLNWKWVRFGDLIKLVSGQDLTSDRYFDSEQIDGIPYLTGASNIDNGGVILNRWTLSPTSIANKGDILLTCKGTIGTTCILEEEKVHIARQIMSIDCFNINKKYILYFIENFVAELQSKAKSMIPGIDRNTVLNLPLPLPPIDEQEVIVKKIEELLPLLKDIEKIVYE